VAAKKEKQVESDSKGKNVEVYEARNIDDALDLLSLANEKPQGSSSSPSPSSSSSPPSADGIERHPERRMKAAYAKYEERELPLLKVNTFPLGWESKQEGHNQVK